MNRGKIVRVDKWWGWNHWKKKECWNYEFHYENDNEKYFEDETNEDLYRQHKFDYTRELIKEINQLRGN